MCGAEASLALARMAETCPPLVGACLCEVCDGFDRASIFWMSLRRRNRCGGSDGEGRKSKRS